MFLILDGIVLLLVTYLVYNRQWKHYDFILMFLVLELLYLVSTIQTLVPEFILSLALFTMIGTHFSRNLHIGFILVLIVVFSDMAAFVFLSGLSYENYYMVRFELTPLIVTFLILKYFFFYIQFRFYRQVLKEDLEVTKVINVVSLFLLVSTVIILELLNINYLKQFKDDYLSFYAYLLGFVGFVYVSSVYLAKAYLKEKDKRELMMVEISRKRDDVKRQSETTQNRIISEIKYLVELENYQGIINYIDSSLKQNRASILLREIDKLPDATLKLIISNIMTQNGDINFKLELNDFSFEDISASEAYFIEIFVIILRNAVEAARNSDEKIVKIAFLDSSIRISNSYDYSDLSRLTSKTSIKRDKNRINGLKLLDKLQENTDLIIVSKIEELVSFEMMVIS